AVQQAGTVAEGAGELVDGGQLDHGVGCVRVERSLALPCGSRREGVEPETKPGAAPVGSNPIAPRAGRNRGAQKKRAVARRPPKRTLLSRVGGWRFSGERQNRQALGGTRGPAGTGQGACPSRAFALHYGPPCALPTPVGIV